MDQHFIPEHWVAKIQAQLKQKFIKSPTEAKEVLGMDNATEFSWGLDDLVANVDGSLISPVYSERPILFNSVSTDTRTLEPGALYIALKGEQFDGHDFIEQAIQKGAAVVLVSEVISSIVPAVLVNDTRLALGKFARWHRQQMPVKKLIAVTGSNGKTTTKSLLLNVFQRVGHTLATEGNLNNELGVPRTLLNLRPEHEYAIIEMGANHGKEISYLTQLALPDIALITNASDAHLEGFGSLQGIIEAKGEIFQGLNQIGSNKEGVAVINTDSSGYLDWVQITKALGITKVVRFGTSEKAGITVSGVTTTAKGIQFNLIIYGVSYAVTMPVLGEHNAFNAAACVAIALSAGLSWDEILPGLESFRGVSGRLQQQAITTGCLIDDSYNANPASVKAGISTLVRLSGHSILCLGAMAELGAHSVSAHQEIALYAKQQGVDYLFVYGQATQSMPAVFGEQGQFFDSHKALYEQVARVLKQKSYAQQTVNILVKGSRSAQMERVSTAILEEFSANSLT